MDFALQARPWSLPSNCNRAVQTEARIIRNSAASSLPSPPHRPQLLERAQYAEFRQFVVSAAGVFAAGQPVHVWTAAVAGAFAADFAAINASHQPARERR